MAIIATMLALYEFGLGRRSVPAFKANMDPCPFGSTPRELRDLRRFLTDNANRIVFVDLILNHDSCDHFGAYEYNDSFPEVVSLELGKDDRYDEPEELDASGLNDYWPEAWPASLTIIDADFDEALLTESSFGDGSGVQLARGLVYIANDGEEFFNKYRLVPVPFSFEAERVYRCTAALAETNIASRMRTFFGSCLFS